MWKTILSLFLRGAASEAADRVLNPLPPTDGTDFNAPAQVKRRPRRTLEQLLADEQATLARLLETDIIGYSPAQMNRFLLQVETVKARIAMFKSRIEAAKGTGAVD